jgi:hypothetical protein
MERHNQLLVLRSVEWSSGRQDPECNLTSPTMSIFSSTISMAILPSSNNKESQGIEGAIQQGLKYWSVLELFNMELNCMNSLS